MTILVIGGSGRNVGKTTLACGLIAALPEFQWTAVKITSHGHGLPAPVFEETIPGEETAAGQGSDTARYLAAGARRALLVTARGADLSLAALWSALGSDVHILIESNRIIAQLRPDICLAVVGADGEAKPSFAPLLRHADAVVARRSSALAHVERPIAACEFCTEDLSRLPQEMLTWLRGRLSCATAS